MKALTLHQPWASLVAAGVKRIETRSWRTSYRGPLAIHASKRLYTAADKHADPELWHRAHDVLPLERNEGVYDLPYGAVVCTVQQTDCVPMVHTTQPRDGHCLVVAPGALMLHGDPTKPGRDVADQRPFGDFRPGRWAHLYDDIAPTTERCPWCWGAGRLGRTVPGVPREVCTVSSPCPVCWPRKPDGELAAWDHDGARGRCDPIPARGRQGLWDWTPGEAAA